MNDSYQAFFGASAGAAAAFIGLLFVALSFIDGSNVDESVRSWRRIMASSSFAQLIDIFFVSLLGLTPGLENAAFAGCFMAVFGVVTSVRLLPGTMDKARAGRERPSLLGLIAVGAYGLQFIDGLLLLHNPNDVLFMRLFILALIALYAGALARAWEITGLKPSR